MNTLTESRGRYVGLAFAVVMLLLRLAIGGAMFEAGLDKYMNGSFTAAGYISHGTGPIVGLFQNLISYSDIMSQLVIWGEMLIGAGLITGTFVRPASLFGIIMMLSYYLPYIPPSQGWIDQEIIYLFIFVLMIFSGAGYFLGLDNLVNGLEDKKHWTRIFFG